MKAINFQVNIRTDKKERDNLVDLGFKVCFETGIRGISFEKLLEFYDKYSERADLDV